MPRVGEKLGRFVREEVDVVKSFVTTPKGVFETVDEMIRVARRTVRDIIGGARILR